jgi:opacity protein-like surface antigen
MRRLLVMLAAIASTASPALAQDRVEVSAFFGWTVSDGVPITTQPISGVTYNRVDPKDSQSLGLTFGVRVTPAFEVEFLWSRQYSQLEVRGTGTTLSGTMNVDNYHGNFVFNFANRDAPVRPFIFGGAGATSYGDAAFPGKTVQGISKFSWAVGGGLKAFPSPHVGFKGMFRWTPTHIKTVGTGWWCDPWFGCYPSGTAYYANQFEFSGGIVARF